LIIGSRARNDNAGSRANPSRADRAPRKLPAIRMRLGPPLTRAFFERPGPDVARALLGAYLVHELAGGTRLVGRIVEVEAYLGDGSDPGSHSHRGETPRNRSMFGPAGRLYAYCSYGLHTCANVVCEARGRGAAVLLRALEPCEGVSHMRALRGLAAHAPERLIASGPGRLAQALGITLADDGRSLLRGALVLRAPAPGAAPVRVGVSARIGLTQGAGLPYRFFDAASACVSRARPGARGPSSSRTAPGRPAARAGMKSRARPPSARRRASSHRRRCRRSRAAE
jgi:DNA-3-methyladenine glycosylase